MCQFAKGVLLIVVCLSTAWLVASSLLLTICPFGNNSNQTSSEVCEHIAQIIFSGRKIIIWAVDSVLNVPHATTAWCVSYLEYIWHDVFIVRLESAWMLMSWFCITCWDLSFSCLTLIKDTAVDIFTAALADIFSFTKIPNHFCAHVHCVMNCVCIALKVLEFLFSSHTMGTTESMLEFCGGYPSVLIEYGALFIFSAYFFVGVYKMSLRFDWIFCAATSWTVTVCLTLLDYSVVFALWIYNTLCSVLILSVTTMVAVCVPLWGYTVEMAIWTCKTLCSGVRLSTTCLVAVYVLALWSILWTYTILCSGIVLFKSWILNLIGVIADWSATVMDYLFEVPAPLNVEINVREDMPKDAMHVHSGDGDGIEAPLEHDPDETDFYESDSTMDRDGPGSSEKYTDVEPPVHYPLIESVDRIVALNLEMQDDTKLANDVARAASRKLVIKFWNPCDITREILNLYFSASVMKELTLLKALGIEYNSNKLFDLSDASHLLESLLLALKMKMAKDSVIIPEKMEMLLAIKNRLYKYY